MKQLLCLLNFSCSRAKKILATLVLSGVFTSAVQAQEEPALSVIEDGVIRVTLIGIGGGPTGGERGEYAFGVNHSTLVEIEDRAFLFDAGRGTTERITNQLGKTNFQKIDKVYLTHLHSDHNVGLPDLWVTTARMQLRKVPMQVFGPEGTSEMAAHIEAAFEYSFRYSGRDPAPSALIGTDISQGIVYDEDGVTITAFEVDHTPQQNADAHDQFPALGFRVDYAGRSVLLSGDTRFSENLINYAKGVDVLIHEVTVGTGDPGHHTNSIQTAEIFNRVKPKLAVYSHIDHRADERLTQLTRDANYDGPLLVGQELDVIMIADEVRVTRVGDSSIQ